MKTKNDPARRPTGRRGFTLAEILITVAIIGMLAAISIPSFSRARVQSRTKAAVNDLRVIYDGFQQYSMEMGDYSAAPAVPAVMPTYMEGFIKSTTFTNKTPVGGYYYYKSTIFGALNGRPAIGIVAPAGMWPAELDSSYMLSIDKNLDDGDVTSGLFVRLSNRAYYYILE